MNVFFHKVTRSKNHLIELVFSKFSRRPCIFVTEMKSLMLKEYVCEVSEMFLYL